MIQPFCTQNGLRLPTEAEWEYAYRAGTTTAFHNASDDETTLGTIAWYAGNSSGQTHAVGGKLSNALGIHDMSGNVREWVNDLYGATYYSSSPAINPTGPSSDTSRRVERGGYFSNNNDCRASHRHDSNPTYVDPDSGFRAARNP